MTQQLPGGNANDGAHYRDAADHQVEGYAGFHAMGAPMEAGMAPRGR